MPNPSESYEEEVRQGYDRWMARANARAMAGRLGFFLLNTPLYLHPGRLQIQPSDRVLDLGCGSGTLLVHLARRIHPTVGWHGIDLSAVQLQLAKERVAAAGLTGQIELRQGSGRAMEFPSAQFDLVLASHVLHHLPADQLPVLFHEIARVLRPGGRFLTWAFARAATLAEQDRNERLLGHSNAPPDEIMHQLYFHSESEVYAALAAAGLTAQPLPLGRFLLPKIPRFALAARRWS